MSQIEGARVFREAWIAGVQEHFPGEPKPSYVTPWDDTPEWERQAAGSVYEQVHRFLELSGGHASRLSREQKGRFIAICWTAQIFKHFEDPKPSYVADWPNLPDWQKETDADIFEAIEKSLS
ncbi:hypothetical protein SBI_05580 [Streptomyces bingchenggensis BCW-1]|uniref:Uncharacterized protein n=1 Tax=Streptomyces bingchenggensis (strain BCW-1) TaxID=749414 RepID=D7CCG9_STRBB|nr:MULTISPECIES: hypothetical protein [Streptomyces]ADI08700.1 hypothetical protein SBI_05580 [Streptomyces bingchenggensis BCW-1]